MALFLKRSTHSIDTLPKSLHIGVLSSFGGKAPLVLANTSSTGNYDCRICFACVQGMYASSLVFGIRQDHRNMNFFRRCCIRMIRQVRISRRTKRHIVRRHFPPEATGRVSIFSNANPPNFFFQTALNKLREGELPGEIHGNCLRYHIKFDYIVGSSVNGSPSERIRVVCKTGKCSCQRTLPIEIKTIYPVQSPLCHLTSTTKVLRDIKLINYWVKSSIKRRRKVRAYNSISENLYHD